jgi:parvulin-like peptidyl-prolyl isomerase
MLDIIEMKRSLQVHLKELENLELHEVLHKHQLLQPLVQRLAEEQMAKAATFGSEEEAILIGQAWQDLKAIPPTHINEAWENNIDESEAVIIKQRLHQLRLQKRLKELYAGDVEQHFLARRDDLERITYRTIRVKQMGLAEELYLRLLNDEDTFENLATHYSDGEERMTAGLLGPMSITDPHPTITKVLRKLSPEEISPPVAVESWYLVIKLERRQPAKLNNALRLQLENELLSNELTPQINEIINELTTKTYEVAQ